MLLDSLVWTGLTMTFCIMLSIEVNLPVGCADYRFWSPLLEFENVLVHFKAAASMNITQASLENKAP